MTGSSGNLVATELRRADQRARGVNGARVTAAAEHGEIIDYTQHDGTAITLDGPAQPDPTPALPTRTVTSRRRVRSRHPAAPELPYERPNDDRSELERLRSVTAGLVERVAYLEAAMGHLSQELYSIRQSGVLIRKDASS